MGYLGDGRDHKDKTRAQQRAAGTNNTALFDIVNAATANGSCVSRDVARVVHTLRSRVPSERSEAGTSGRHDGRFQFPLDFAVQPLGPCVWEVCHNGVGGKPLGPWRLTP